MDEPGAIPLLSRHPAVSGREGPLAAVADAVRRLVELTVTTDAPSDVLQAVASGLEEAIGVLGAHVPSLAITRFAEPDGSSDDARTDPKHTKHTKHQMHQWMPYDPVIGRFNPLALPFAVNSEGPTAFLRGTFTTPYEGAPGCVHGAAIAGAFDLALTAANHIAGLAGPTVSLGMRFRRPTLVGVECRFEAEVVSSDGRRVHNRGRLVQDGVVTVEADGEFAVLDTDLIRRLGDRARTGTTSER